MSEGARAAAKQAREDTRADRPTRAGVGYAKLKERFR